MALVPYIGGTVGRSLAAPIGRILFNRATGAIIGALNSRFPGGVDEMIGSAARFVFDKTRIAVEASSAAYRARKIAEARNLFRPVKVEETTTAKLEQMMQPVENSREYNFAPSGSGNQLTNFRTEFCRIHYVNGKVQCPFIKRVRIISTLGVAGAAGASAGVTPTGGTPSATDIQPNLLFTWRQVIVTSGALNDTVPIEIGRLWPLNYIYVTQSACDISIDWEVAHISPEKFWNVWFKEMNLDYSVFYSNFEMTGPLIQFLSRGGGNVVHL